MPLTLPVPDGRPVVFLSHSTRDKLFVERLKADLEAQNFSAWMYEEEIPVAAAFPEEINKGLEKSDHVIVVHSAHFVASGWSQQELNAAMAAKHDKKIKSVIFLRMDATPIPMLYAADVYADFRGEYDGGFRAVLRALTGQRDAVPATPAGVPVDRAKLVAVLDTLDPTSLTQVIGRITPRFAHDIQMLSVPVRVQNLLAWAEGGGDCELNEIARVVVELFPGKKAKLPPFI